MTKFISERISKVVSSDEVQKTINSITRGCNVTRRNLDGAHKMRVEKQVEVAKAVYDSTGQLVDYCEAPIAPNNPEVRVLIEDWTKETIFEEATRDFDSYEQDVNDDEDGLDVSNWRPTWGCFNQRELKCV